MLLHQFVNGTLETMYPSIQKDTTFTKIFVGGLPYHTTDASLRKYFETFGDIDEAVVITDRQTGKSRGYGFVSTISCVSSVVAALAIANSQKLVKLNAKNNTLPLLGFTPFKFYSAQRLTGLCVLYWQC